jgi:NAD(P)-dependent dehydrogenase (short-subunit alcohol dehydrogenase family)
VRADGWRNLDLRLRPADEFPAARGLHNINSCRSEEFWIMSSENGVLRGKRVVVLGASRGVGREIVLHASAEGAQVLAVARQAHGLADLEKEMRGVDTLALDAASEAAPLKVFRRARPDLLVICGGATPPTRPMSELSWAEFGINWEVDAKMAFLFCREALRLPLAPGSVVVIISSGAGLGGSPISGGYAGAKRMQMFIAKYCQAESDRRELGIRFAALVPSRVMPETDLGQAAVNGYAKYLGVPAEKFLENMGPRQSPTDVAKAVLDIAMKPPAEPGSIFTISADGFAAAS